MMEEKERPVININIHGGNNQILPVATKAEQHFHFSGSADAAGWEVAAGPRTAADEARLSVYVSDREKLRGTSPSSPPARRRERWARPLSAYASTSRVSPRS